MKRAPGFTLIEVMVALVIVAFGMGAVLATLSSAADTTGRLRDQSLAMWIGFNQISTVRLALPMPADGKSTGEVEYAGSQWRWQQVIDEQQVPGVKRITVQVKRLASAGGIDTADSADAGWLASTVGFRGDAVNSANGQKDWNGIAFNAGAVGGGGGAGAPGGNNAEGSGNRAGDGADGGRSGGRTGGAPNSGVTPPGDRGGGPGAGPPGDRGGGPGAGNPPGGPGAPGSGAGGQP